MSSRTRENRIYSTTECPQCAAPAGKACTLLPDGRPYVHAARRLAWQAAGSPGVGSPAPKLATVPTQSPNAEHLDRIERALHVSDARFPDHENLLPALESITALRAATESRLALTANEAMTVHWALIQAISKCRAEIKAKDHMAENAMALVDYDELKAKVDDWLNRTKE